MIVNTVTANTYFYIIIAIQILAFAAVFNVLYYDSKSQYKEIRDATLSMCLALIGEITFTQFDDDGDPYGEILMFLFFFLCTILCINLLIAILTKGYSIAMKEATSEYRSILLQHEKNQKLNDSYGVLIAFPAPFSAFVIFVLPFLLRSKEPEKVNQQALRILFQVIYIPMIVLMFFFINLCLIPMAWFKMFQLLINNINVQQIKEEDKDQNIQKVNKSSFILAWFFLGFFIMVSWIIFDVRILYKFLIDETQPFTNDNQTKLTQRHLDVIKEIIESIDHSQGKPGSMIINGSMFDRGVQEYFKKQKIIINQKKFNRKKIYHEMVKKWLRKYNFGRSCDGEDEDENAQFVEKEIDKTLDQTIEMDIEGLHGKNSKRQSKSPRRGDKLSPEKKLKQLNSFSSQNDQDTMENQRKLDKYLIRGFAERIQFKDKKTRQLMIDIQKVNSLLNEQKSNLEGLLMSVNFQQVQRAIELSYASEIQQSDQASFFLQSIDAKFQKLENRLLTKLTLYLQEFDLIKKDTTGAKAGFNKRMSSFGETAFSSFQNRSLNYSGMFSDFEEEELEEDEENGDMSHQVSNISLAQIKEE